MEEGENHTPRRTNQYFAFALVAALSLLVLGATVFYYFEGAPRGPWVWVSGVALALVVLLGLFFAVRVWRQKEPHEPDYYVFFILGLTWLPIGIATEQYTFVPLGIAFMALGLANRTKWKERTKWSELSEHRKRFRIVLLIALATLFLGGVVSYYLYA